MVLSVGIGAKGGENFIPGKDSMRQGRGDDLGQTNGKGGGYGGGEGGRKGGREAERTVGREKEARAVDRATPFDLIYLLFDFQTGQGEWM